MTDVTISEQDLDDIFAPPDGTPPSDGEAEGAESPEAQSSGDSASAPDAGDPAPEPGEPTPTELAQIDLLGRKMDHAEAKSLAEFYDWAKANPSEIAAFDRYLRGEAELVPRQQGTPTPPQGSSSAGGEAGKDEDDDDTAFLEDLPPGLRAKLAKLDQMDAFITSEATKRADEELRTAQAAVVKAAELFQAKHGLTNEDMTELQGITASLGVLPSLAAANSDMISAVDQALDIAYWSSEKFRQRAVAAMNDAQAADKTRKRKAGSLAGSSGSVPRIPRVANSGDRREAMVAELRSALNGGT